jgi:hypothetical protein
MYYTPDWDSARESVRTLAEFQPDLVVTGHGRAMQGQQMRLALEVLARDFDRIARLREGRYTHERAKADATGTTYVPPKR